MRGRPWWECHKGLEDMQPVHQLLLGRDLSGTLSWAPLFGDVLEAREPGPLSSAHVSELT